MNEEQLVASLEPYVLEVLEVGKRLGELEVLPRFDQEAVSAAILAQMKADPAFRGAPGNDGAPATPLDLNEVIICLKADAAFVEALKAPEPNIDEIVKAIVSQYADKLKGEPGQPGDAGVPPTAEEVAVILVEKHVGVLKGEAGKDGEPGTDGKDGIDGEPGAAGKDADPGQVAEVLKADESFLLAVKGHDGKDGEDGQPGSDGKDGADGKDADPIVVAETLKQDETFRASVKGDPGAPGQDGQDGADSDPAEVAANLRQDESFLAALKGEPGEPGQNGRDGRDGLDGAGIFAPLHVENKVYREGSVVQAFLGQHYKAKCDTAASPGDSEDWERVGTAGWRWRGTKPDEKSLKLGDIYIDGGSMFGYNGEKGFMMVQRPKAAPEIKSIETRDNNIVLKLSNGQEIVGAMNKLMDWSQSIDALNERIEVLDEALRKSEELVAQMSKSMQLMHVRLQQLEANQE